MKNTEKELFLNLEFLDELVLRPTIEEEFELEKQILEIQDNNDLNDVKLYAISAMRQGFHQSYFITTCIERIIMLETKLFSKKHSVKQPKTFQQKLKAINAILFDKQEEL